MDVTAYLVDWDKVVKRFRAGTLMEDAGDAIVEYDQPWLRDLEFGCDSDDVYVCVAQAYEQLRRKLPPKDKATADTFFNAMISLDTFHQDLGDDGKIFAVTISPDSAKRFAAIAQELNLKALRKAFEDGCSKRIIDELGEGDVDAAFSDNFLPYLKDWIRAVKTAAKEKKGICWCYTEG
jgi:hypothetical protein